MVGVALRRPLRRSAVSDATWASAVERYRRGVARYDSTVRIIPDRTLRRELLQLAAPLEATLEDFEEAFANAASGCAAPKFFHVPDRLPTGCRRPMTSRP